MSEYTKSLIAKVKAQNTNEPEFHQAVEEVVESLKPRSGSSSGISFCKNFRKNG